MRLSLSLIFIAIVSFSFPAFGQKTDSLVKKLLNICLLLSSLIGYLEWGKDNHAFLFQTEYDLIFGDRHSSETYLHPFVLLPLIGQLILLFTVFQKKPGRGLTMAGLVCLSLLMLLIFFIGIITLNVRIFTSSLPFVVTGILILRYSRKWKNAASTGIQLPRRLISESNCHFKQAGMSCLLLGTRSLFEVLCKALFYGMRLLVLYELLTHTFSKICISRFYYHSFIYIFV